VHVAECLEGSSQGLSSKGAVVTVRNERGGRGVPKASNAKQALILPDTKRKSAHASTTKHASLAQGAAPRQRKILKKCGGTGDQIRQKARVEVSKRKPYLFNVAVRRCDTDP
jgi:hypothetical protein